MILALSPEFVELFLTKVESTTDGNVVVSVLDISGVAVWDNLLIKRIVNCNDMMVHPVINCFTS